MPKIREMHGPIAARVVEEAGNNMLGENTIYQGVLSIAELDGMV